jgi:hypothetical protein
MAAAADSFPWSEWRIVPLSKLQSMDGCCRLLTLGWMDNFHAIKAVLADSSKPKMAAAAACCPWGG